MQMWCCLNSLGQNFPDKIRVKTVNKTYNPLGTQPIIGAITVNIKYPASNNTTPVIVLANIFGNAFGFAPSKKIQIKYIGHCGITVICGVAILIIKIHTSNSTDVVICNLSILLRISNSIHVLLLM